MSSVELMANGTKQKFTDEKTTVKTVERVFLLVVFDAGPPLLKAAYCNTALDKGTPCGSDSLLANTRLLSLDYGPLYTSYRRPTSRTNSTNLL